METADFQHQIIKYHFNEETTLSDLLINSGADHVLHLTFLKKKERLIEYLKLKLGDSKFVIITDIISNLIRLNSERNKISVCQSPGIWNHDH